jgi:prepilin-type N-terminal cleavage/methylation domain-containing protein
MKKIFRFQDIFNISLRKNAFTLIELIITITIFTVIIVTVYGSFYMGIKAWHRGEEGGSLPKIRTGLLKMEKELKSTFYFSNAPFSGTDKEISFPLSLQERESEELAKVYIVTYSINNDESTGRKQLVRKERIFNAQPEDIENEKTKILLPLINNMSFEYAYEADGVSKGVEWQGAWKGGIPSGIKISMELDNSGSHYDKVIFIQQGVLGEVHE